MRALNTDAVIVGAGLAGASLASLLGRQGIKTLLVDPKRTAQPTFKAEKIEPEQAQLLRQLGLLDVVLPYSTPIRAVQSLRAGRLLRSVSIEQYGIFYDVLVNALRREVPKTAAVLEARVESVAPGPEVQEVRLEGGASLRCRLVVLASGTAASLNRALGLRRRTIESEHCLCFGFNLARAGGGAFGFESITCYSDDVRSRLDYLTLFPIGEVMRANLFVYRRAKDPWVKEFTQAPEHVLSELVRGLSALTGPFNVVGRVELRVIDLYVVDPPDLPGIVLVGDAFQSVSPATGTGLTKVLTDVDILANECAPRWLATPGTGAEKIAEFYRSPRKVAVDRRSLRGAISLRRRALDPGWSGRLGRLRAFGGMWLRGRLGC